MSKELLLLEELCKGLGFSVEFDDEQAIPSGQIIMPAKYTLTHKGAVNLPIDGDAWVAIVNFVASHADDIRNEINDYGDLMPVIDYFNRNS